LLSSLKKQKFVILDMNDPITSLVSCFSKQTKARTPLLIDECASLLMNTVAEETLWAKACNLKEFVSFLSLYSKRHSQQVYSLKLDAIKLLAHERYFLLFQAKL